MPGEPTDYRQSAPSGDGTGAIYLLRLYIVGGAKNSVRALNNLEALCRQYLAGRYELEVVDILQEPKRTWADRIIVTPTLVRLSPVPIVRIAGNLNETGKVLEALSLREEELRG